jgi:hypothetical protein
VSKVKVIIMNPNEEEKALLNSMQADDESNKSILENNELEISDLSFYPNPSQGKFTVSFSSEANKNISVKLLDLSTKVLFEESIDNFNGTYSQKIDISDKGQGLYLLQITQGDKTITKKVFVQ